MGICYLCGKETDLEYRCPYCNLTFCEEHRLPEQHNCVNLPERDWDVYRNESIRIGRFIPTQSKERLLGGFDRPILHPDGTSKKEYEKDTDTSFIRKNAKIERQREKQKPSALNRIPHVIIVLLLIAASLIIIHELGYIDLYQIIEVVQEWIEP